MCGRGAGNPEGSQRSSVLAVGVDRRKAGLTCEDRGGGRVKGVGDPSADTVPEGVHRLGGSVVGDQKVGSIRQNRAKQAHGDVMSQEGAGPTSRGREAFYEGEGGLGQG